jgi:hypothetical protein
MPVRSWLRSTTLRKAFITNQTLVLTLVYVVAVLAAVVTARGPVGDIARKSDG